MNAYEPKGPPSGGSNVIPPNIGKQPQATPCERDGHDFVFWEQVRRIVWPTSYVFYCRKCLYMRKVERKHGQEEA